MSERTQGVKISAKWKIDSPVILSTNAFRCIYTPSSTVLYFGLIDPEILVQESQKLPKENKEGVKGKLHEIITLARYNLDHDSLLRLKQEVDKTVEGLKKMGALKNAK